MDEMTINIKSVDGLFHATSPQMPALFVSGETMLQCLSRVPEAIEGLNVPDDE